MKKVMTAVAVIIMIVTAFIAGLVCNVNVEEITGIIRQKEETTSENWKPEDEVYKQLIDAQDDNYRVRYTYDGGYISGQARSVIDIKKKASESSDWG